jgi:exosortase
MQKDKYFLLVISILFAAAYPYTIEWMWERWLARDSYYSHGFLVPFITGFLIYRKRQILVNIPKAKNNLGFCIFLAGILLQIVSSFWRVHFISGFSMPVVLFGLVLYLYGIQFTKEIAFALLFLFFMIPMPLVFISEMSLYLKLLTTKLTIMVTNVFGITVVNQGNVLYFAKGHMVVGDVCSGLRSLISLLAMGALYAYLLPLSTAKRVFLFLSAIPISVISNMVRMFVLCIIAHFWGVEKTGGLIHDSTGILIYITAFGLLFSLDKIFLRRGGE